MEVGLINRAELELEPCRGLEARVFVRRRLGWYRYILSGDSNGSINEFRKPFRVMLTPSQGRLLCSRDQHEIETRPKTGLYAARLVYT